MKGTRSNAIVDTDSDVSDDDAKCQDFSDEQLNQSMKRLKLHDDEESYVDSDDENLGGIGDEDSDDDDDDRTIDMSLKSADNLAMSDDDEVVERTVGTKTESTKRLKDSLCLSDGSILQEKKKENEKKEVAAYKPARVAYNIMDDSSSSSSNDDSFDEYLQKTWRNRDNKDRSKCTPKKWYKGTGGIGKSPPPRHIQLQTNVEAADSSDEDSVKIENAMKNGWSYNKIRREYSLQQDRENPMPPFCLPSKLYNMLFDFQKDGVKWMASLHVDKIGGILADDMGLGKTFMTLSLLGGLMRSKTIRKALVVAPVSVLRNWENEAKRILTLCTRVKIDVIASDSSKHARERKLKQALEAQSPQLVITTFGLVTSSPDQFRHHRYTWDYIILDEAHKIKNPAAQVSQNVELVAANKETRRLILTGTPIMNNLKELHALFTFATSGRVLGSHQDFRNEFGKPIEDSRSADAADWEVEAGEKAMKELQDLLRPYFLQRLKKDYLKEALPEKKEYVLWTNLSPLQRKIYQEYVESKNSAIADYFNGVSTSPLFAITWLQKLCGHPLLVENDGTDSVRNFHDYRPEELLRQSAKLQVMYDLLNFLQRKGHRTLIFSQSTMVLDIIQHVLKDDMILNRIDGQTKEKDRQRFVDAFNDPKSDVDAMLISTKAGGQGLTLTGADTVVVYDPSWNPAEDSQAVDRCYRIGQRKKVTVYRLITSGTVEEKRYEKQIHKDGLRRTVFTSTGSDTAKYFTKEELVREKVFVLGEEGKCEFLDKLNERGLNTLSTCSPEYIFTSHRGVVGQSSHDIVYSLPENWHKKKILPNNPFNDPSSGPKWYESTNHSSLPKSKVIGRAQRVLQKTNKGPIKGRKTIQADAMTGHTVRKRKISVAVSAMSF
ncbi:SNF2/helicase domain containing protein [Nitzschia inconspicua]|uniref:SNF2/helicase domain containing protein n=1 Tax=Nitzschia inconspicua TaxID=303405 RepID=A0A9K3PTV6_9STRA|nr:SNF2/helicase domain containing protein [Nitzschia inconspicua]